MLKSINDVTRLSNGVLMPWLGLGVWQAENNDAEYAVKWAVEAGCRHIDTAAVYENEVQTGKGIKECGVSRHDLFVTSKFFGPVHSFENAIASCEQTLKDLQTDYLDLFLIHWPLPKQNKYVEVYHALEKLYRDGKVRAIGVSNFYAEHIDNVIANSDIVPHVLQVEYHPFYQQKELQAYCKEKGIQYEAYSPLAQGAIFESETLKKLAEKYGKSVAQLVLRWELQNGVVVIPKSVHQNRIIQNSELFDFEISAEDMKVIDDMDEDRKITCPRPDELNPEI